MLMAGSALEIVGPWLTGAIVAGSGGFPLAIGLLALLLVAAFLGLLLSLGAAFSLAVSDFLGYPKAVNTVDLLTEARFFPRSRKIAGYG